MVQTVLIISLVVLVAVLSVLLTVRILSEKKHSAAIRRMNLADFSEFLRSNSQEDSIQTVAGHVSNLLKEACGCERIIFLRKRRQVMELNYFHGISRFNRRDLRARQTDALVAQLRGQVFPEPIEHLRERLPASLYQKLREWRCDLYFPVFWRDHLYGLYFIKSSIETRSQAFQLLVAALAQSLSAAYHIRWHEDRHGRLQERIRKMETELRIKKSGVPPEGIGMLKLVRHRDSETLVGRIIEEVQKDLNLSRLVFLYQSKRTKEPLHLFEDGVSNHIPVPEPEAFRRLLSELEPEKPNVVPDLENAGVATSLSSDLQRAGLRYVVSFPLSPDRSGLLAWDDEKSPEEVLFRLRRHSVSTAELIGNAVSFERVEELSYTDSLTGLSNQRYFLKRLGEEIGRAKRYQRSLALIIFDLDELKSINDSYGHQAGDVVIKQMGEILLSSIRSIDVIARYGGDEFCVIMPESDSTTCRQFMGRLQKKIAGSVFKSPQLSTDLTCTISQGGAVYPDHGSDSEQLIFAADMALLKAKEAGRNRYLLY